MSSCDKSDYIVARQRTAALGKLDKAVVDALDHNALLTLCPLLLSRLGYLDNILLNGFGLFKLLDIFVLDMRHQLVD